MADSPSQQLSQTWQKVQATSVVVASVAIPVVVAMVGNAYTKAQKDQEISVRYVELAIGVLRSEPTTSNKALRTWAVSVVDHLSPVPLPEGAKSELELQQLLVELSRESKRLNDEAMKPLNKLR